MKQFSLVLNIILLLAVSFLYYLFFKNDKKRDFSNNSSTSSFIDSNCKKVIIAYVELDSLNNNVSFIKIRKKELEAEQKTIMSDYENAYRQLEAEKNNFLKRGNAITQKEAEEFQGMLMQKQQQVEADKQAKTQKLAERGAKIMENVQSKLKEFLNVYNKDKKFTYILATGTGLDYLFYKDSTLNITREIVKGLNEKMNNSSNQ